MKTLYAELPDKLYGLTYEGLKSIDPEFEMSEEAYNQIEEIKSEPITEPQQTNGYTVSL